MGLFGFVKKAVGFAAKTALSKVTGGVSDKVFAAMKATKAIKTMAIKPSVKTTASQLNDLKYSSAKKLPKAGKVPAELAAAARAFYQQPAARRGRAPKAPRAPKEPRAARASSRPGVLARLGESAARTGLTAALGGAIRGRGRKRQTLAGARRASKVRGAIRSGAGKLAAGAAKLSPAARAGVAGAAAAGAFAVTRRSKLGGKVGDAVVSKVYADKAARDQRRLNAFRAQLKKERAAGKVSSARVKEIAKSHGL